MDKKVWITIVLILILGIGYYGYSNPKIFNTLFSKSASTVEGKFSGNVTEISGNKLSMRGVFTEPVSLASDLRGSRDFTINLDNKTVYKKTEILLPSAEMLKAQGNTTGIVSTKDMAQRESDGSLEDFKQILSARGAMVTISFLVTNNLENLVASEVFYKFIVEPKLPQ